MKIVIPAAGRGSRLMPLTEDKPKCLVKIGDRPLLSYVMDSVYNYAERYIITIGYKGEQIKNEYGNSYRGKRIYYVEQDELKGLAHSLYQAREGVKDRYSFMTILGDNIFNTDMNPMLNKLHPADGVIMVEDIGDIEKAKRYGVCNIEGDRLIRIDEKPDNPQSTIVSTGLYVFDKDILDCYEYIEPSDRGEYEITDLINEFIDRGNEVRTVMMEGERVDVGYPEDIERAERLINSMNIRR